MDIANILTLLVAISPLVLAWYQFFYKRRPEKQILSSQASKIESETAAQLVQSVKAIDELRDKVLGGMSKELITLQEHLEKTESVSKHERSQLIKQINQLRMQLNDYKIKSEELAEEVIELGKLPAQLNEANRQINIYHMRLDEANAKLKELDTKSD